jgi:hypothetical protein
MAGAAAQGQRPTFDTSDQVRPREDFQFSFLWKGLIPHCPASPTQIRARRPGPGPTVRVVTHVPTVTA